MSQQPGCYKDPHTSHRCSHQQSRPQHGPNSAPQTRLLSSPQLLCLLSTGFSPSSPCVLGSLSAASEMGDLQQPPHHPPPPGHPPNHQPVCNYDRHPILKNLPWLCVYFGLKSSAWNISSWMSFALAHLPSSCKKYPPSPSPLTVCSLGKQRRASPWKGPTPFQNWFILSALYTRCLGPVMSRACKSVWGLENIDVLDYICEKKTNQNE